MKTRKEPEFVVTEREPTLKDLLNNHKPMDKVIRKRIKEGYEPRTKTLFQ